MKSALHRPTWAALAALALCAQAQAQTPAPASEPQKLETITVTGSLIKRTDKETPSVVQSITRQDIQNSGYTTIEEMLRSVGAVDASSIQDGAATGFVGGLSTISLRGFGSQGTLVLINGRRVAPVAAVDVNFGRGSLISVNTIPRGAIERVDVLKDGASALYGSDAMAGVVNYILRKDYEGAEGYGTFMTNDQGVGDTKTVGFSFGFGNLDSKGFNVFGGAEVSKRDAVFHSELKDKGSLDLHHQYLDRTVAGTTSGFRRFTPDSAASPWGSYYRVPASNAGSTVIDGRTVGNNSPFGQHYLGTYSGCPADLTVGQGVATRPTGIGPTAPSFRTGQCRFNFDNADQAISAQERGSAMVGASFALGSNFTLTTDLIVSKTKTTETPIPQALTTTVVSSANPVAVTWSTLAGELKRQNALILPVGHPDNPTNGTATPIPVQVIYRFVDLNQRDISELESTRFSVGLQGSLGEWDIDTALMHSRTDNKRILTNRLRNSLLTSSLTPGSANYGQYRFNGTGNSAAAIASIASDAVVEGESSITSLDVRGSRDLFAMSGGQAAVAVGLEYRKEELESVPDATYKSGDMVGLVGNGASGDRSLWAAFTELRLPVLKSVEVQAAARHEKYSDFGNATTGKLGAKWAVIPSTLALRGTVATGFRAPGIAQIADTFLLSFHNFQTYALRDPIRCPNGTSLSDPQVLRDCNVLGRTATNAAGSIPSIISANPNLKPEKSKSATVGMIFSPTKNLDVAIDAWYFERNDEIRVQRGVDLMEAYIANRPAYEHLIIRDPNPSTWLPGVANSGPIVGIRRVYGNYQWSKTSGVDYDLNFRLPAMDIGKVSFKLSGTYTPRFDQLVLAGGTVDRFGGTSSADIPRTKANATIRLDRDDWNLWARYNHQDKMRRIGITEGCLAATSGANGFLNANGGCYVGRDQTIDIGFSIKPIKGLTIAASVLNVADDYARSVDIPYTFNYWDQGTSMQLGRRFNLNISYKLD